MDERQMMTQVATFGIRLTLEPCLLESAIGNQIDANGIPGRSGVRSLASMGGRAAHPGDCGRVDESLAGRWGTGPGMIFSPAETP